MLQRNFWFCTIDDPSTIDTRHRIGVENIMVEIDYPHGDGTWPDTQAVIEKHWGHIPADELRVMMQRERGEALPSPAARGDGSIAERAATKCTGSEPSPTPGERAEP